MPYITQFHSETSQSPHCRPQPRHAKSVSFLTLPGEIRNKIYDLLFAGHVLIHRSHRVRERVENAEVKSRWHLKSRRIYPLPASTHFYVRPTLLRVCRQLRNEAVTFLYANTAFRLESIFTMNKFLNAVPAVGAIRKLELRHSTYGEPRLTEDRRWKHRHDKKWMKTCRRMAEEMTALEHLKLELRICDWPTQLNLAAAWAKPLLELKGSKGIGHVEVTLLHDAFNEQRLQAASNVVARAMMSGEGRVMHELLDSGTKTKKPKLRGGLLSHELPNAMKASAIKPDISLTRATNKPQPQWLIRRSSSNLTTNKLADFGRMLGG